MKNTLLQFLWYKIIIWIVPTLPGDINNPIRKETFRILTLAILGKIFRAVAVLVGDSNQAKLSQYHIMKTFDYTVINIGVGGTTADHWNTFFETIIGSIVYRLIRKKIVLFNIGGNYVLQRRLLHADTGLAKLSGLFMGSYNINIPPLRWEWLEKMAAGMNLDMTAEDFKEGVDFVNMMIRTYWRDKTIDIASLVKKANLPEEFLFLIYQDAVHYQNDVAKFIVDVWNRVIQKEVKSG